MSDCGLFDNEVFVDTDGTYVGDFSYGDGPGGPFGWVGCMVQCDHTELFEGVFVFFAPPDPCPCPTAVRINVALQFGAGPPHTVTDISGPLGLEAMPAMRVDLPGAAGPAIGWAGPQVVDEATGLYETGVLGGSTGWSPAAGEEWIFQCWARVVPDRNGITLPDGAASLHFTGAPSGFASARPSSDDLSLTSAWQFYQTTFDGGWYGPRAFMFPMIEFGGAILNVVTFTKDFFGSPLSLTGYGHYGSVEIKCAHLYRPAPTDFWVANYHGHGPV